MTSDKWRLVTLDWDKFAWNKAYKLIKFIFNDRKDITKIKVYSSPNLDGYHIYIYFDHWLEWSEVLKLRRKYQDDDKRLINDLFKTNPEEKMILFQNKNGKKQNIHPSLLPKFPGLNTHQRAIDAFEKKHGASVHFVTEELDGGPVIAQEFVNIDSTDNAQTLAKKVLDKEHVLYPKTIHWYTQNRLKLIDKNTATLDKKTL